MTEKLLVLGASGLTGYKIAQLESSNFEVLGTFNTRPIQLDNIKTVKLDISNKQEIENLFKEFNPNFVVNATALHNVDYCEDNPQEANMINCDSVKVISNLCDLHGSRFVHLSTDYVFDGKKKLPYLENDEPIPLSEYGKSKLMGENFLAKTNHVVLRPSVVYGWTPMELAGKTSSSGKPMNFAMWLLTKLHNGESLKIVTDQFASATLADTLANAAMRIARTEKSGIFHVAGLSCESRYEFSKKFAKEFGYDENLIQPTDSSQFKQKAKRPTYSCLDCTKSINEFNLDLLSTEQALKIMKNQVKNEASHLLASINN